MVVSAISAVIGYGLSSAATAVGLSEAVGSMVGSTFIGSVVSGALVGAGTGAITAAVTGGNIGKGLLMGAVSGGLGSAIGPSITDFANNSLGLSGNLAKGVATAITGEISGTVAGVVGGQSLGAAAFGSLRGALEGGLYTGSGLADIVNNTLNDTGKTISGYLEPTDSSSTSYEKSMMDAASKGQLAEWTYDYSGDPGALAAIQGTTQQTIVGYQDTSTTDSNGNVIQGDPIYAPTSEPPIDIAKAAEADLEANAKINAAVEEKLNDPSLNSVEKLSIAQDDLDYLNK